MIKLTGMCKNSASNDSAERCICWELFQELLEGEQELVCLKGPGACNDTGRAARGLIKDSFILKHGAGRSGRVWESVLCAASPSGTSSTCTGPRVVTSCCVTSWLWVLPWEQPWWHRHRQLLCLAREIPPTQWGTGGMLEASGALFRLDCSWSDVWGGIWVL